MTSPWHVSSPLPPPSACDRPDEEAPLEVDSDSSSDGEGVVGASKASELGHSPSRAVMTRKATVVTTTRSVKAWTHGCPLYSYNTSLWLWDRGWTWISDTQIIIGFVASV